MDGVFWHSDMGFLIDSCKISSSFPDAQTIEQREIGESLKASGQLPSLGPAPVASWLLARLFHLTRERLGFETQDRSYNDGGGYYLDFVTFSRDLKPEAFFYVHGHSSGVRFWGTCATDVSPEGVLKTFMDAVLESPTELMVCKLTTSIRIRPSLDKRSHHRRAARVWWDGNKFLGFRRRLRHLNC